MNTPKAVEGIFWILSEPDLIATRLYKSTCKFTLCAGCKKLHIAEYLTFHYLWNSRNNMHWDKIIIFLILESVMGYHNMDNIARIINGQNAANGQFPYQVCFSFLTKYLFRAQSIPSKGRSICSLFIDSMQKVVL